MGALPSSCMEETDNDDDHSHSNNLFQSTRAAEKSLNTPENRAPDEKGHSRMSPLACLRINRLSSSTRNSRRTVTPQEDETEETNNNQNNINNNSITSSSECSSTMSQQGPSLLRRFKNFVEEAMFPRSPLHEELARKQTKHIYGQGRTTVRGGVMLEGCHSVSEHYQKIQQIMDTLEHLHGAEGLAASGLEYRFVLCAEHRPSPKERVLSTSTLDLLAYPTDTKDEKDARDELVTDDQDSITSSEEQDGFCPLSSQPGLAPTDTTDVNTSLRSTESLWGDVSVKSVDSLFVNEHLTVPQPLLVENSEGIPHCHLCHHRLFHVQTNTPISLENRKKFIADGDMYEAIADLCQEYAHEVMCEEAQLEWVCVEQQEGEEEHNPHPHYRHVHHNRKSKSIRALVNSNHPLIATTSHPEHEQGDVNPMKGRPTILIATGRGKVRAGIFSRQHLICTSLESSTALPIVREARVRKMNVVIPDPNARGERYGYDTFGKTMKALFSNWEQEDKVETPDEPNDSDRSVAPLQERDLYVLSHSASGAQVARYLMDKPKSYLPHIQAVAFTDSTHNIQWVKNDQDLQTLLESPKCVYFRCSNEQRDSDWYRHATGEEIKTDEFWRHRFGKIQTFWAGTNEHSLTNWYAHAKIWEHFDRHLSSRRSPSLDPSEPEPLEPSGAPSDPSSSS